MEIRSLQVGMIETNCYLLCDTDRKVCAVIDPGDEGARILSVVRTTGCTPCAVLLTHGHYDHTGAVEDIRAAYPGIPVYLKREDTTAGGAPRTIFPPVPDTRD